MLEQMRDSLVPHTGRIILALVLPFKPFVENSESSSFVPNHILQMRTGDGTYGKPIEALDISGDTWEENVESLGRLITWVLTWRDGRAAEDVFGPLSLRVDAVSRTPYLCQGDNFKPYYVLRDTIFVLSHVP